MRSAASHIASEFGPLQLLILQATPFCNIDCKYCYLPDRQVTRRMKADVAEAAVRFVLDSGLVEDRFTVCWHAGEPLAVPISYYRQVVNRIRDVIGSRCDVFYNVQTNGTTINQEWCDFFREYDFQIGMSIDGPQFLHDANRVTRNGEGTFAATMRGAELLKKNGVPFHVIAVLTRASLPHANLLFDFFREVGATALGYNIEEAEGVRRSSSIAKASESEYASFLRTLSDRSRTATLPNSLYIRELATMESNIRAFGSGKGMTRGQENRPFAIMSVDYNGNISTFSPEMLGCTGGRYNNFLFGNVLRDRLEDVVAAPPFRDALRDINLGIEMCEQTCEYFDICGGGAPSNKFYENGTFVSTETINCRFKIKIVADQVIHDLERSVHS